MTTGLFHPNRLACRAAWLTGWMLLGTARAWVPGTGAPLAAEGFSVNRSDRRDVLAFHHSVFNASQGYAANMGWTGNLTTGTPGTTTAVFKEDVRRRINYYRALAGLPADIVFNPTKSAKCQEDALMSSRNGALSHNPPSSWIFYTANAAQAAANSNLTLGYYGPGAIDAYLRDDGANNYLVGHRRWLLYTRAREMGTGDVPPSGSYLPSNTTWVIGDAKPAPAPVAVAFPGAGYFPFPLMPARWSLSYPGANFASAVVTMTRNGAPVATTVVSRNDNGYADNTLVWEPAGLPASLTADTSYTVTVSGIGGSGVPTSQTYTVILFDPAVLGESITVAGPASPATTGAAYSFNAIAQADAYEVRVNTISTTPWTEGAETTPAPRVISSISPQYTLTQTSVKRSGSRGFHLTFPNFDQPTQVMEIDREIVPTASSSLVFYDMFRFVTAASRLSAEVSENGGVTWSEVWGRPGSGSGSSASWDQAFVPRSISLSSRAGKPLRIRFVFRHNDSAFLGSDSSYGVFLDDISVSAASEWVTPVVTSLGATTTGWTLNASTAGAALQVGTQYVLRMRANVGRSWFTYGNALTVTARAPNAYETWAATRYPTLTGPSTADADGDGLSNLFEYAFDTNPLQDSPLPPAARPTVTAAGYGVTFSPPAGVSGVVYGAEWSPDLTAWFPISNAGSLSLYQFRIPTTGNDRRFFRLTVLPSP